MISARTPRHLSASVGLCSALATLTFANAQTEPGSSDTARLQEAVVTGPLIGRSAKDQPVPAPTLTQKETAETGFRSLSDILTQMPEGGYGAGPTYGKLTDCGPDAGATSIGCGAWEADSSSSSAVDMATIPSNMIERLDVTAGGAAACQRPQAGQRDSLHGKSCGVPFRPSITVRFE